MAQDYPRTRSEAIRLVQQAAEDYLEAFKPPFSTLHDLNGTQRQELFGVIMDQMGAVMEPEAWAVLEDKPDITVEDIVDAFDFGSEDEE